MNHEQRKDHIFVDASNLFIEGMRLSSYLRLGDPSQRVHLHPEFDFEFRIDLRRLCSLVGGAGAEIRPLLVGSRSDRSGLLYDSAAWCGFDTVVYERDAKNREKKVDATIILRALLAALDGSPSTTRIVLVAGDSDYVPLVEELRRRGFEIEVIFWAHGSRELQRAASRFVPLDRFIDLLRYKPVSHPASDASGEVADA